MIDWTHWHNEPLLIGVMVVAAWAYALAVGPWRHRIAPGRPFPRTAALFLAGALLVFYAAVGSPLDQIGERFLFFAHMIQHLIIVYVVAPLLIAGTPSWLVDATLRLPGLRPLVRLLTRPVVAAVTYVLCVSLWHVPTAYDYALRVKFVHVMQHLMFLGAALVMWWPLLSRSSLVPRSAPGVQVLYLVALGGLQMPLIAFLCFSRATLYPTYEFAPRLLAITAHDDQVLGGAIMGVGGMFIALGLLARAFYNWHRTNISDERDAAPDSTRPAV